MLLPYSDSCLAAVLGPHAVPLLLHRRATSMALAWDGALLGPYLSAAPERACGHACMLASVLHSFVREQHGDSPGLRPPQPPQLRRISMVEREHIAPRALGPLDAAVHRALD
jgi:hypothetical protein